MKIVVLGLTITSSWGNGHATTYNALCRALIRRGHDVLFLERDEPWYASNRDLPTPDFCKAALYRSLDQLRDEHGEAVSRADAVIVGSYVPQGVEVGRWAQSIARGVVAFYDIDTPVTLEKLSRGDHEYISPEVIPGYGVYLSITGGGSLEVLEQTYGAPRARTLYCSVDPDYFYPERVPVEWEMGYLGTHSDDRLPALQKLMLEPAARRPGMSFVVAGPRYPRTVKWPGNVRQIEHLPPPDFRRFYCSQRFSLNLTRQAMKRMGYAPSIHLFEAAACGVPVVSDIWDGIETLLEPGTEILLVRDTGDVLRVLDDPDHAAMARIGARARERVLAQHTADHRAAELEAHLAEARRTGAMRRSG